MKTCSHQNLYVNDYSRLFAVAPNWKQFESSSAVEWINEGSSTHWKKKRTVDIYNKMDESLTHYAKWKKPGSKGHILNDSIYLTCRKGKQNKTKLETGNESMIARGRWGSWLQRDIREFFRVLNCFISWLWGWLHNHTHLSKLRDLYTIKSKSYCM